jgi:uridine phosphorylase
MTEEGEEVTPSGENSPERSRPQRTAPITAADLPIGADRRIYHLQLKPEQLAPDILLVGDPGRASLIAETFFAELESEVFNRGLRTVTGRVKGSGMRISVVTSGMGTPSLEVVLQELVALNEIDFDTRLPKEHFEPLHLIRVGTSGGLQPNTRLGTPIISTYSIGMDNTALFYDAPPADSTCEHLEQLVAAAMVHEMSPQSRFRGRIQPYASKADAGMVAALEASATELSVAVETGITVSNSGFFCNQGRDIARVPPSVPDIDKIFTRLDPDLEGIRFENLEMETSFLFFFASALKYRAGAICITAANRELNTFAEDYIQGVKNATAVALRALEQLRAE